MIGRAAAPDAPLAPADAALFEALTDRSHTAAQRRAIAKTITLLESTRAEHRGRAERLLDALLPVTGASIRIGISGAPGVGKSTFIEAFGLALIDAGQRVAVLAIDPSSRVSGGSILGDKTRMERLSVHPSAYIRPSPAAGTLGGVAARTRETLLVCEAAGYDVVIVETVGVGQSETAVAGMTDVFVLLQLPNAGDDLQAMKKGVMELADLIVINKADIDPDAATRAEAQVQSALRLLGLQGRVPGRTDHRAPKVMRLAALSGEGLDRFRALLDDFVRTQRSSGALEARRKHQALDWFWELVAVELDASFKRHPVVRTALPEVLRGIEAARLAPSSAARSLLELFHSGRPCSDEPITAPVQPGRAE